MNYRIIKTAAEFPDVLLYRDRNENGDETVIVLATPRLMHERAAMVDFKLKTVCRHMGIEVVEEKLHDAEYDIDLTRQLYHKCLQTSAAL